MVPPGSSPPGGAGFTKKLINIKHEQSHKEHVGSTFWSLIDMRSVNPGSPVWARCPRVLIIKRIESIRPKSLTSTTLRASFVHYETTRFNLKLYHI